MVQAKTTVRVTLSEDDVKTAVIDWLKRGGFFKAEDEIKVKLNFKKSSEGYGVYEHDVHIVQVEATADK